MRWDATPDALAYNLYGRPLDLRPPDHYGRCLYHGIRWTGLPLPMVPQPGVLWILQVTAVFRDGEGPMGLGQGCRKREPAAPCQCTLPADVGPCDAAIPRWFHDFTTRQCSEFIWGGCEGNANNFESEAKCESVCEDPCGLPPEPGECEAAIPRWFHDPISGRCEIFIWGGCGGNSNNFVTQEACEARCPG